MKYLRLAFSFLTTLPVRAPASFEPGDLGRSAAWYPLVGAVLGVLVAAAYVLLKMIFPPLLAAALGVGLWVWLTGGLHLDGLADCCDGLLNASTPERRLEIMRDPRLGTFGGAGLILQILLKVLAVLSLPVGWPGWAALILAPALGRWMILLGGRQPQARPGGLGADFALGLQTRHFFLAALVPLVAAAAGGLRGGIAVLLAHLTTWGIFTLARKRLNGVTGDVYGAAVELSELAVLLAFCLYLPFGM